jgi:hypothetical protein
MPATSNRKAWRQFAATRSSPEELFNVARTRVVSWLRAASLAFPHRDFAASGYR